MDQISEAPERIFRPDHNCWRIEKASHASIIVDYANYYRDLHQSICNAKESLFILGWDIDGRIELLRGDDAKACPAPTSFFELIKWKLEQNPDFKVYLNKWDYSIFFAKEREPLAGLHWATIKSENFHYCIDSILPLGACHHQKVAVIDDEVAYCGGMDIALARWDFREHHPINKDRHDPAGLFESGHNYFAPYHDLMMVTSGDAAQALAEMVRERWKLACKVELLPLVKKKVEAPPQAWPQSDPPDFENVDIAIARTLPPVHHKERTEEIIKIYLDEIEKAEEFIYIENQFLVQMDIARALNKQLRLKKKLRILAISCDKPKGIMERKSMWAPRIQFREVIESGGVADRVALVHPISREDGREDPVRIHSKLMIIDDKFLHLGSANINNRSMGMDTECDQVIIGNDEKSRNKIAAVRTDLIREHSGREAEEIEALVKNHAPIAAFLEEVPTSRQHFKRINDEEYRHERFVKIAKFFSDPRRPLITADLTMSLSKKPFKKHLSKPWVWMSLIILALIGCGFAWHMSHASEFVSLEKMTTYFENLSHSIWNIPVILAVFVLSGIILFPVTILIGATAAVFGPVEGFMLAMGGTLLSAATGFWLGKKIGFSQIKKYIGPKAEKIRDKLNHTGIIGMSTVRMLPIAPFGLVNMMLGMASVTFMPYIIGAFLGLLPGTLIMVFLGDSLSNVIRNPSQENIAYVAMGLAAWVAIIISSHILEKKLNRKKGN